MTPKYALNYYSNFKSVHITYSHMFFIFLNHFHSKNYDIVPFGLPFPCQPVTVTPFGVPIYNIRSQNDLNLITNCHLTVLCRYIIVIDRLTPFLYNRF